MLGILEFTKIRHCGIPSSSDLPCVILELDPRISIRNFRRNFNEIPRSSRGMTQGLGILEFLVILLWEF